ncbi:hypothetical protein Dimus_027753 [Dionaea muscipula]
MASSISLSASSIASISLSRSHSSLSPSSSPATSSFTSSSDTLHHHLDFRCSFLVVPILRFRKLPVTEGMYAFRRRFGVVCMAPEEQRITRRSPLDFPWEWVRPKSPKRADIFPQFSPMKTPLPVPMPSDPPLEIEEEEEEFEEQEEEYPEEDEEESEFPEQ